jgi:hypothetical protein
MKNIFYISAFILLTLITFSCHNKGNTNAKVSRPHDLVSPDEMRKIMVNVFLAEVAITSNDSKHWNAAQSTWHYYNYVFKKHNITYAQFQRNYTYYSSDTRQMTQIMTNVIDDLSQLQSKVKNQ